MSFRDPGGAPQQQTFLFLQGHPSSFARELADELERANCRVLRVNFCLGDVLYWRPRRGINYRGSFADWPGFLQKLIKRENVSDILYYGDSRPYHRTANEVARDLGIRSYTYEFGYLRPDWITLERGGMSARSHFPNDPEIIRAIGAVCPQPDLAPRYAHSMALELAHEIFYNLSSYFLHVAFHRYHSDRYYNPILEYITGIPRQLAGPSNRRRAERAIREMIDDKRKFFLFPLQLQNDYQLRHHAAFRHQSDAIRLVIASFAAHAPEDSHLIFKCHPLDNGGEGWPRHIEDAARASCVSDRTCYIDGGDLKILLANASGTVLINSTVGMYALQEGCPLKVLGTALFDIVGLTHEDSLDTFWRAPTAPDEQLVDAFVRALAGTVQIKGNFLTKEGRADAIRTFVQRLIGLHVNGHGAFVNPPPRLEAREKT